MRRGSRVSSGAAVRHALDGGRGRGVALGGADRGTPDTSRRLSLDDFSIFCRKTNCPLCRIMAVVPWWRGVTIFTDFTKLVDCLLKYLQVSLLRQHLDSTKTVKCDTSV
jgi:hypothetical protein